MRSFYRKPIFPFLLLLAALLALIAAGAIHARQAALTRGIPLGLPDPIVGGDARLGINVYLANASEQEIDDTLSRLSEAGFKTLKQTFYFNEDFDWSQSDRFVEAVRAQELSLIPLLDGNPQDHFRPPADPEVFASWAGEFAIRYGDFIDSYIIWDEPNLTSHWGQQPVNANDYAALLTAAASAIRVADGDALIVAAPLAPTTETGPMNLADHRYLKELYEAGAAQAFDVAAAKPYGFDTGPQDRTVDPAVLNFSRAILLREEMERNGDAQKALWAGNWGWNSLPPGWQGSPSIWGQVSAEEQAAWTVSALERAQREWPWMGLMFLENWEPGAEADDPRWGFSIADRETAATLSSYLERIDPGVAYPGFHLATPDDLAQEYEGGWRFSAEFGADISQPAAGQPPDRVTFTFWGTDVGLAVRRANFRARLNITVDGQPANALPQDENGAALILTSPDPEEDYLAIEPVATNLPAGIHTMEIITSRGWDQWALHGFSVGYDPVGQSQRLLFIGLMLLAGFFFVAAIYLGIGADWGSAGQRVHSFFSRLGDRGQLAITAITAALVSLTGWLTWGQQLDGIYRRLGDGGQIALTAATAGVFYLTPTFYIYLLALAILFLLIYLRPAWGLALVVFSFPFYVSQWGKPVLAFRFSPVEIFTLVLLGVVLLKCLVNWIKKDRATPTERPRSKRTVHKADYAVLLFVGVATLSLFFTERLGVATNEWRTVIVEPALFYFAFRAIKPEENELWIILDAFVLGGLVVCLIGLGQYATGQNLITAEGGLMRLRSIYGSPNNVALYLGRILPLLLGVLLLGRAGSRHRRWVYSLSILPMSTALLLTFSKGGLLLGVPAGALVVFWIWQRRRGRSPWLWVLAFIFLGAVGLFLAQTIPPLADRLNLWGATGVFRVNLWRSSLEMIRESPLVGVGLDNFLYAYRGRYILDAAWQEPNLNHPHNFILDFGTRLGLLGLLAGGWMIWVLFRTLKRVLGKVTILWLPVAAGFSGALGAMLIHGLVDHSFFLVDLAFVFYLMLGVAIWLDNLPLAPKITEQS